MQFNKNKCKVLGMGKNNENRDYMMQGANLERVTQEKDLGVAIDTEISRQDNARQLSVKPTGLGCFHRGINYKSKEVVLTLYRNLVRPHLD